MNAIKSRKDINPRKYEHMLRQRLAESHGTFLAYYDNMTACRKSRYVQWIVEAERESTRIGRIDKAVLRLRNHCDPDEHRNQLKHARHMIN